MFTKKRSGSGSSDSDFISLFYVTKTNRVLLELNGKYSKCKKMLICKETKLLWDKLNK
jgi:hypothetical protein